MIHEFKRLQYIECDLTKLRNLLLEENPSDELCHKTNILANNITKKIAQQYELL